MIARLPQGRYPGDMKSKTPKPLVKAGEPETLAQWLLANGGFLNEEDAREFEAVIAANRALRARLSQTFYDDLFPDEGVVDLENK